MPLLTLNLSCENVKYPARKHFEKTNISNASDTLMQSTVFDVTRNVHSQLGGIEQ